MANQHKDITGQRFGRLEVIEMIKKGALYHAVCKCACGTTKTFAPCNLRRGMQSCGCLPRARKPPLLDMVGQKFGLLEVVAMEQAAKTESGRRSGLYYAVCNCSCGTTGHPVIPAALKRGATTSCGCRRDQYICNTGERNSQFKGFKEIRAHFWRGYVVGAAARGLTFDLTMKYAWSLFENQGRCCALSGVPLVFGAGKNIRTTASLDRLDNSKGYVEGNVQWVHKIVNIMRNTLSVEDFLSWCRKVVDHNP